MRRPTPHIPQAPAAAGRLLSRAGRGGIFLLLIVLLLIVQLPLFWMLITSFKARGTAFQLQFIPQTRVHTPADNEPALSMPVATADDPILHFEHHDPAAGTVDLALMDPAGELARHELQYAAGGLWLLTLVPDTPGTYLYTFELDGEELIPADVPAAELLALGLVEEIVAESGAVTSNTDDPQLLAFVRDGKLLATATRPEDGRYELLLNGRRFPLSEIHPGIHELHRQIESIHPEDEPAFRLTEIRSFGTAAAEMYTLDNFRAILTSEEFNFARYFLNSLVVATSAGILTVILCTMGGYAFSQMTFHFRDQLFVLVLASMLVPGMIFMVPQFSITIGLGLMNTYPGMVVPHLANIFGLFLLRQYIGQIPRDLFAAAEIDGASQPQIFQTIVVPICLPIMLTLFLLTFVTQWSNFLWQLIINTGDSRVLTLPVGLQQFRGQNTDEWEMIMAGASFSIVPMAILFLCFQGYFLRGLAAGAVKE